MQPLKLKEIIKATNGRLVQGNKNSIISNISIDTRTIKPNDLFIAIKGKIFDGHSFIREALQKGVSTIIAEDIRFEYETWKTVNIIHVANTTKALEDIAQYYRQQFNPTVIAVTGSNGKTTTKEMIAHILKDKFKTVSAPASYNNNIGVPLTILNLTDDIEMLILEMEMNELGGTRRLCEIAQPDIGLITNIGDTHLEFLFTRDNVAKEKSELLEFVSNRGTAILNADDAKVMEMWTWVNVKNCLTFGIKQSADVYAKNIINHGEHGTEFVVNNEYHCRLHIPGIYNIYNALAAISVAQALNCNLKDAIEALATFKLPSMRMEKIKINGLVIYNDAFNANPQSVLESVNTFVKFQTKGKRIVILGDMLELGQKSAELHRYVGKNLPADIDILITVGEQAKYIADGVQEAKIPIKKIIVGDNIDFIFKELIDICRNNDTILIKGSRLMKLEEIVNKLKLHYHH